MPLCAGSRQVRDEAAYFDSLVELDRWAATPSVKLSGVLDLQPRPPVRDQLSRQGKLLVCHDYKGGYTENPFDLGYTFNFWTLTDTFIYFSHHRVTIPPPGWITAAHRNGTRILGTLIFEGSGKDDCLRLLVGNVPTSKTGPALPASRPSIPLSPHYARLLADLAHLRGFDGYLLNVECQLDGGIWQTKALAAWITLLRSELVSRVGPHAQAIWYDSVIFTGLLRWQDRLNSLNLPFFLASSSIFTNYTWPPNYPSVVAQYFLSLDKDIFGSHASQKCINDIYMGVDVWGRGSHGGGGFGSYKAISHIAPDSLGLSVALFGQAWTWESEQDKPGWTWEAWWNYERKLWLGSQSEPIFVPEVPPRPGEPECVHGPFLPISSFFRRYPPPDPAHLALHSTFCPGVGRAWFVEGVKVMQSDKGWTDIDKQCSLGDMVWPYPSLAREEGDMIDELPDTSSVLCMDDAWNGGSSLRLSVSSKGFHDEEAVFRCLWLPVQSLSISSKRSYEASIVFKLESTVQADIDLGFSVKPIPALDNHCINITNTVSSINLPNGWTRLSIQFSLDTIEENDDCRTDVTAAIGFVIGIALETPTQPFNCSILVGQLNVFACPPPKATTYQRSILWADFSPQSKADSSDRLTGVLTWDTAVCLAASTNINVASPDDPIPVWTLDPSDRWFPSYLYFNIYLQAHSPVAGPDNAAWIGTTGLDGKANEFVVDVPLPEGSTIGRPVRLYVQGVTDHGEVLPWQQCVFVEVNR